MEFVIKDKKDLARLRNDPTIKRSYRRIKITLAAGWEIPEKLQQRINKAYFSCGCASGAIAVYVAILSMILCWLLLPSLVSWSWWLVLTIIFLASIIGKVIGIVLSRYKLKLALLELEPLLASSPPQSQPKAVIHSANI